MSSNVSTSADPLSDPVTPEHFNVWGRIVYAYASAEYGFKLTLAGIMDFGRTKFSSSPTATAPQASETWRNPLGS